MTAWISALWESTAVWTLIGIAIGYLLTHFQDRRKARGTRESLGSLLYGDLTLMDPEAGIVGLEIPTARTLSLKALPQLLQPGIIDPQKDHALLMQLLTLADAVENVNEKVRTYNEAWASDRHPQVQALCREDLSMAFMDYRRAHALTKRQIEFGNLGRPLPFDQFPQLTPKQRFQEWRERQERIWRRRIQSIRGQNE